jgi:LysM repeat protein
MISKNRAYYHEVQARETLYAIARKYGLTVKQLVTSNNFSDADRIYPGQKILIIGEKR